MTTVTIQSPTAGDAGQYSFTNEEYFPAAGKQQILADWQHFITTGFKKSFFTRDLYRFVHQHCDFTAHTNRETFWGYTFNSEVTRLRAFLNQFGGNGHSAEYGTQTWLNSPAADLKRALCQEMAPLYPPLMQVLEDLQLKHAELGRVWREFALRHSQGSQDAALHSHTPDPGYPPDYVVGENTRDLLAYAAQVALHKPQPLQGLQRQFPPAGMSLYIVRAA